ncbi:MAG: hypothetical protein AAF713_10015 [Pseudomonadota bacterium]
MTILNRMEVVHGDIRSVQADLLVVKYANYNFGADEAIRAALGVEIHVVKGHRSILPGRGLIGAKEVAFLGVGDLWEFRYERIRNFGARTQRCWPTSGPKRRASLQRSTASVTGSTSGRPSSANWRACLRLKSTSPA